MEIKNILIYGSSYLTAITVNLLKDYYNLVGHIPSTSPTIKGKVNLPIVKDNIEHDIKLSLQYDKKLINIKNAFNVHTGLLPMWGGTDILYHTLQEKSVEQGLTFHKMGKELDYGNIISKVTYPVTKEDTMITLYDKMVNIFPLFVLNSLKLLETMTVKEINSCTKLPPRVFKRGKVKESDNDLYKLTLTKLRNKYE